MTDYPAYVAHDTRLVELYNHLSNLQIVRARAQRAFELDVRVRPGDDPEAYLVRAKAAVTSQINTIEDHEENYTGWSRFFLVNNVGGHIHRSLNCSTCFYTTSYSFLPQLSGQTEADAVADQGEILCSVCFPSAPSEWTNGVARKTKEERAERAQAKDERAAKKAAKAIKADGTPLVVETGEVYHDGRPARSERIETIAAAKSWLTSAYEWNTIWNAGAAPHPSYPWAAVEVVATALAERTEQTVEDVKAAAEKRAQKRTR